MYTPPHLANKIRAAQPAFASVRRHVTVLFADMKGSMEMLVDRDPEEVGQLLDRVVGLMMEAVHRYEGTVAQVLGDGVMALFGGLIAQEDHAVRACYAALSMQDQIAAHAEDVQRTLGISLQIRVGLNSGEVVLRSVQSDLEIVYTAMGQTVHLAARMEQLARPGTVLATAATLALAGERVRSRERGSVPVSGLREPVSIFEVLEAVPVRSRFEATGARVLAPFVGREREVELLREAVDAVRGGPGRVVSVVGEAGVGKSRLVYEFAQECRARGFLVAEAAALPWGKATDHRSGVQLIRKYFELGDGEDARSVRDKVTTRMLSLDATCEDAIPGLLWLVGALGAGSSFLSLELSVRRQRANHALVRLARREGEKRPFIIMLADLQWADSETLASVEHLARQRLPGVLVVLSYRPGYRTHAAEVEDHREIGLQALDRTRSLTLLESLLGGGPDMAPLAELLAERTGGNPLYLEECVRSLVESGGLYGERGAFRLARPVSAFEIPPTVRAVIEARIDGLPDAPKRLLQCAAVIGDEVPEQLLAAIAPPDIDLAQTLAQLTAAELLQETALYPNHVYVFRHPLTHDVVYDRILHDQRRALHVRVMEAIERLSAAGPDDHLGLLAHHAYCGEVWSKAAQYLRLTAAALLGRLVDREASELLERALDALRNVPQTPETRALGIDVRLDLHAALVPLGERERILGVLREAEAMAAGLGDDRRHAQALSFLAINLWNLGDSAGALTAGQRALTIAERSGEIKLQAISNFSVGGATRALGQYRRAVFHLRRNIELLRGPLARETFGLAGLVSVLARGHLAWSLAELGEFDEAMRLANEAVTLAQDVEHIYSLTHAHLGLGGALIRRGHVGEALAVLERGLVLSSDAPVLFPPMAVDLGLVYVVSGRAQEGIALARRGVEHAERMQRLGHLSLLVAHLGLSLVLAGQREEAATHGHRALDLARRYGERGNEVYALRLLGRVAAAGQPCDEAGAGAHFQAALVLAEELGMRPLAARTHLSLGRLAQATGGAVEAVSHLEVAARLFQEMGMTFWMERLALEKIGPTGY